MASYTLPYQFKNEEDFKFYFLIKLEEIGYTNLNKKFWNIKYLEELYYKNNFKKHLEKLNQDLLLKEKNSSEFSEEEFNTIYNNIKNSSFIEKTEFLQWRKSVFDANIKTKDNTLKRVQLKLIDKFNINNNSFEFAEEVCFKNGNKNGRFDIVIFINGIPITAIE